MLKEREQRRQTQKVGERVILAVIMVRKKNNKVVSIDTGVVVGVVEYNLLVRGQSGSLFKLGVMHVVGHVIVHGLPCSCLALTLSTDSSAAYTPLPPCLIRLVNWSSGSQTGLDLLQSSLKIDSSKSKAGTDPIWGSKLAPVQKDHQHPVPKHFHYRQISLVRMLTQLNSSTFALAFIYYIISSTLRLGDIRICDPQNKVASKSFYNVLNLPIAQRSINLPPCQHLTYDGAQNLADKKTPPPITLPFALAEKHA